MNEILEDLKRLVAEIDDLDDVEKCKRKVFSIAKCGNVFYAVFRIDSKTKRLHQYILGCKGETIDHINHNGLDNRKENLRIVSRSVNIFNCSKARSNTGYMGISYNKTHKLFQISIAKDGKRYRVQTKDLCSQAKKAGINYQSYKNNVAQQENK